MRGRFALVLKSLAVSAAVCGGGSALAQQVPVATEIRIGGDDVQTRFVVDLTRKIEMRAFTLADPYRVVIDIPQVTFALPQRAGENGRGLVKAYRYGLVMMGGSRLVLDMKKPVRIEKAFVLDARDGQPARMVLDFAAVDRDTFMRNLSDNRTPRAEPVRLPRETPQASSDPRPIVVVDPGHGGPDTGAKGANGEIDEKAIVLEFGLLLRDQLEKSGKYRVVMTRTEDVFIPLDERVRIARQRQASLFISIHADWLARREGDAQGATVYTLSETASDAEAARLADAENKADVIGGMDLRNEPSDVADILFDLAQRETKAFSHQFAHALVAQMKNAIKLHRNPLKSAGFKVLRAPDVPSVLVELGYVSNRDDLKLMTSDAWRAKAAGTVAQAVDAFFATRVAGPPAAR